MINYESQPGSSVVEIAVEGKVTDAELREAFTRLEADIRQHGKSRVLERIEHFTGLEPAALWTDLRLGAPLAQKITHAAVVADAAWIRGLTGLARLFTHAEVRAFRPDQLDEARSWLSAV